MSALLLRRNSILIGKNLVKDEVIGRNFGPPIGVCSSVDHDLAAGRLFLLLIHIHLSDLGRSWQPEECRKKRE